MRTIDYTKVLKERARAHALTSINEETRTATEAALADLDLPKRRQFLRATDKEKAKALKKIVPQAGHIEDSAGRIALLLTLPPNVRHEVYVEFSKLIKVVATKMGLTTIAQIEDVRLSQLNGANSVESMADKNAVWQATILTLNEVMDTHKRNNAARLSSRAPSQDR